VGKCKGCGRYACKCQGLLLSYVEEEKDYSDKFGLFSGRIKPKIVEILSYDKNWLKRLINPKRKKKDSRG